jgi:hypothetical protein
MVQPGSGRQQENERTSGNLEGRILKKKEEVQSFIRQPIKTEIINRGRRIDAADFPRKNALY